VPHVVSDLVDQVDRARDGGIDDSPRLPKILVQERMAKSAPRFCQKDIDLATLRGGIQLVYAFGRRKIGLEPPPVRSQVRRLRSGGRSLPLRTLRSASPVLVQSR
jgi:hypothetical protein